MRIGRDGFEGSYCVSGGLSARRAPESYGRKYPAESVSATFSFGLCLSPAKGLFGPLFYFGAWSLYVRSSHVLGTGTMQMFIERLSLESIAD